jgi:hypothetical protein
MALLRGTTDPRSRGCGRAIRTALQIDLNGQVGPARSSCRKAALTGLRLLAACSVSPPLGDFRESRNVNSFAERGDPSAKAFNEIPLLRLVLCHGNREPPSTLPTAAKPAIDIEAVNCTANRLPHRTPDTAATASPWTVSGKTTFVNVLGPAAEHQHDQRSDRLVQRLPASPPRPEALWSSPAAGRGPREAAISTRDE